MNYPNIRFYMPVDVRLDDGAFDSLGEICGNFGKTPLIVTGRNSARINGALDRALAQLPSAAVFDEVPENPESDLCDELGSMCREVNADCVIAIGGGSPIDAAKAAAGLALNEGPCADYYGSDMFTNGVLPVIAVPTTAGAGSEVTPYSVLIDSKLNEKKTIGGHAIFPKVAILDPALTTTLPRSVTINTGLDALSQAMEGMVSRKATRTGETLSLEAIAIIRKWLPIAADDPENIEARYNMIYAAMIAGVVVAQSGTTLVHGMGYALTVECGVAHGMANALLLTPIFEHNAKHAPATVARIVHAMGHTCTSETAGDVFGEALHALFDDLGVSPAGQDHGYDEAKLAEFASACAGNPYRFRNQIGELGESEVMRFYERSYAGARGGSGV